MSMIQQASRLFLSDPVDHMGRVDLLDQDGFVVAKQLRETDARWIIGAHRVAKEKSDQVKLSRP